MSLLLLAGLTLLLGGTAAQSAGPVFELKRLPRCWLCGELIESWPHDVDDRTYCGGCCPDSECRRIETESDGAW